MSGYWMRLAPRVVSSPPRTVGVARDIRSHLTALLGSRWVWWAPDVEAAWCAVLQALDIGASHCIHSPVGLVAPVEDQARARESRLVEVDLHEDTGAPIWPEPDERAARNRDVFILDHRFGLPSPLPFGGGLVLEDATAAPGGMLGGRPVGSLGTAAVVALGSHPFSRSRGALVATNDASCAEKLRGTSAISEPEPERAGRLADDLEALDDWNDGCRAAAGVYTSVWHGLEDLPVRPVLPSPGAFPTYSAYLIQVPDPAALVSELERRGIEAHRPLGPGIERLLDDPEDGRLPKARAFYRGVVRLPNHPNLDLHELLHAADVVRRFLVKRSPTGRA